MTKISVGENSSIWVKITENRMNYLIRGMEGCEITFTQVVCVYVLVCNLMGSVLT